MKIKKTVLKDFLSKMKMEGTQEINECVWDFKPEGLSILAYSMTKQTRVKGLLKSSQFTDYKPLGPIGVDKMNITIKAIESFTEDIDINVNGNLLVFKDSNKTLEIELVDLQFINREEKEPNLQFDPSFKISSKKIQEIVKDVKLNKDVTISVMGAPNKVVFYNEGKFRFRYEIPTEITTTAKCDFGEAFVNATSNLTGELLVSIKTNYPCKIDELTEISDVSILVVPLTKDEE